MSSALRAVKNKRRHPPWLPEPAGAPTAESELYLSVERSFTSYNVPHQPLFRRISVWIPLNRQYTLPGSNGRRIVLTPDLEQVDFEPEGMPKPSPGAACNRLAAFGQSNSPVRSHSRPHLRLARGPAYFDPLRSRRFSKPEIERE